MIHRFSKMAPFALCIALALSTGLTDNSEAQLFKHKGTSRNPCDPCERIYAKPFRSGSNIFSKRGNQCNLVNCGTVNSWPHAQSTAIHSPVNLQSFPGHQVHAHSGQNAPWQYSQPMGWHSSSPHLVNNPMTANPSMMHQPDQAYSMSGIPTGYGQEPNLAPDGSQVNNQLNNAAPLVDPSLDSRQSQFANDVPPAMSNEGRTSSDQGELSRRDQPSQSSAIDQADQRQQAFSVRSGDAGQTETTRILSAQSSDPSLENFLARKLALQNESIVKSVERVMDRLDSPKVKELANQLKTEHTELANSLRGLRSSTTPSIAGDVNFGVDSMGTYASLYQVCERAAEEHLVQIDSMIADLAPDEIDMAFIGSQLVTARALLAELHATRQAFNDDQLKNKLGDAIEKVENLLERTDQTYNEVRKENND